MMTDAQKWLVLAGVILTGWLLYLLAPVLTPFLIAGLLAYLGDPVVDRLEKLRFRSYSPSRTFAVIIVFAVMIILGLALLLILIPLIQNQFAAFVRVFPEFITWLQETLLPRLAKTFDFDPAIINLEFIKQTVMGNWQDIGSAAGKIFMKITQSGQAIFLWLAYLVLIPVVTFYLLRDWDQLFRSFYELLPRRHAPLIKKLATECDDVLSEFLRGQLMVMLSLGIIYTIGLWIAGLEFALLIGMLAGIASFVPYLGFIVGIVVAGIAALVQYNDIIHIVYVVIVFGIGQMLEGMVLSPWLVGDRIGLHPVAVIFAVMAGGQLFGFFGVLLALPVAAVIVVLLRYLHSRYLESSLYTP
jgi:predicted PurR-regulated permease PerM